VTRARESLQERALRLIADGRLVVTWVDGEQAQAHVRGTDTTHVTGYRRGGWWCDCQAHRFGRRCSHLAALQLVTLRPACEQAAAGAWRAPTGRTG
jgi:hypothetical protein